MVKEKTKKKKFNNNTKRIFWTSERLQWRQYSLRCHFNACTLPAQITWIFAPTFVHKTERNNMKQTEWVGEWMNEWKKWKRWKHYCKVENSKNADDYVHFVAKFSNRCHRKEDASPFQYALCVCVCVSVLGALWFSHYCFLLANFRIIYRFQASTLR